MLPNTGAMQQKNVDQPYSANKVCMTTEFPQRKWKNLVEILDPHSKGSTAQD